MYKSAPSFFLFSLFGTTNCFSCFEPTTKLVYSTFHRTLWRYSSRAFVVRAFPKHLFLDTMKKDALTQVPMSAFEEASKKDTTMKEEHKSSRPPISKKSRGASTENGRTPKKKQKTPSSNTSSPPENEIPKENMSSSKGTLASKVTSKKTEQSITERDPLPKLWSKPTNMFKIISWNVNGIRAVVKNYPNALSDLVKEHKPDLICLQETKLQECHVTDPKLKLQGLLEAFGYDSFWSCSTEKKGYSGTAVFVKRCLTSKTSTDADKITCSKSEKQQKSLASFFKPKQPSAAPVNETATDTGKTDPISNTKLFPFEVSYGLNNSHDPQGRCITVDYPLFSITNAYVPNSGDGLVRLDYRTKQWDVQFAQYMKAKEETRGVPVIMIGDLNVAHKSLDVWNDGAKHLDKCAGTTPEERESFTKILDENDFVDLFRHLHPEAKGHYSFWSTRAGNRSENKGLRLDYFVASKKLTQCNSDSSIVARDSYMIHDQLGSDHCPIVLELEIKD